MKWKLSNTRNIFLALSLFGIFVGVCFRFYHINESVFVYYDEGMYLEQTREFLTAVEKSPPHTFSQWVMYFKYLSKIALYSNKALWFFIAGLRGIFISANALYFTRIVSAVFGTLSIGLVYLFARKFYSSKGAGLLSALLMAFYPSHIFYSRLGLQEAFSAFCFLSGVYFYVFPRKFSWKTVLSGFFFACVFFSNYRMIIMPVLVVAMEGLIAYCENQRFDFKKSGWTIGTFLGIIGFIFLLGHMAESRTASITIGWMFEQKKLAKGHFEWINVFSYPYYLFKLESVFLGVLFFGNIFYACKYRKDRERLLAILPFMLVMIQMAIFSLPQEKGTRYLCVVMPLIVMASAHLLYILYSARRDSAVRIFAVILGLLMFSSHLIKGVEIVQYRSDYKTVMDIINRANVPVGILSSQNMVQNLYAKQKGQVQSLPDSFLLFMQYAKRGYRYLVIDPQAYISYTQDGKRFSLRLKDYLELIVKRVKPDTVLPHFNESLLERFVLEHNENLKRSIAFLKASRKKDLGALRVYDIRKILMVMTRAQGAQNE